MSHTASTSRRALTEDWLAAARLRQLVARKRKGLPTSVLSPSEKAALRSYSLGDGLTEIALRMKVSKKTVNSFLDRGRKKLGARSRAHAVRIAIYGRLLGGEVTLQLEDLLRLVV